MSYAVWGWGSAADEPTEASLQDLAGIVEAVTGFAPAQRLTPQPLADLPAPRRALPSALAHLGSGDAIDRARHAIGRATRDLLRAMSGRLADTPELVVRPTSEQDVVDVLDWASGAGVPVVPFGGGTSVVGGVEPRGLDGAVSLDLCRLSGLVEVDATSRAARLRAGTLGPDVEALLAPHGLTLRFYPQSFERSTVGGWLATRAAGHFSTGPTHIDDLVESIRAITPTGPWESRRLPGSGAGPSPDRVLLGSEGTLGVLTEAWLRVQPRPLHRWQATYACRDFRAGTEAARSLVQAGAAPATLRVLDPVEASLSGTLATGEAVLLLGFESLGAPITPDFWLDRCSELGLRALSHGEPGESGQAWRSTFLRAPYLREQLLLLGFLVDTFETAITWDRLDALVAEVTTAVESALRTVCGGGRVGVRLTHVYADGAAPYFTVIAPARAGSEVAQWDDIKAAASEALARAGGTITHHHAVGRDHVPWYAGQRPEPFARALRAAKTKLDPIGVLNPGVLLPFP
jgi:alkyldihydroxyacetonephosphate synthase